MDAKVYCQFKQNRLFVVMLTLLFSLFAVFLKRCWQVKVW